MTTILAIDTATDACSVALYRDGELSELYEVIPRQQSQRLVPMLQEMFPHGDLRSQGVEAIAYGCGPGSFTGLRIAASAVQALAFANGLPAIAVSTLACQAQGALRLGLARSGDAILSVLDARINEVYWSFFKAKDGLVEAVTDSTVCAPGEIFVNPQIDAFVGVGGGFELLEQMPPEIVSRLQSVSAEVLPGARDIIPLALAKLAKGEVQHAEDVAPVYVREEVSWKKLAEQGKPA